VKIAVVNLKGGVGKTITSVHVAANLGRLAPTVLVDADPQGSASEWSAMCPDLPFRTVALGVSTIGSRLPSATADFEHIVIDTPPGDTGIVRSAVKFATTILVPVQPTLQDLNRLRPTLELIVGAGNDPDVLMVLTRVRSGTRSVREAREVLSQLGLRVLNSEIPLLEAYAWGFGAAPPSGHRYGALTDELMSSAGAAS
jgi:chromosome partitioning protein